MTVLQWILSGDTGLSSETIWGVMMGALPHPDLDRRARVPRDIADFGRCFRLLMRFPDWKDRMLEMERAYHWWGGFAREWESLEKEYLLAEAGYHPREELNFRIHALAREADRLASDARNATNGGAA